MVALISRASGNLTSASTWGTIINEDLWPNSNNISSTTSYVFGRLFTSGASNQIEGFALFGRRGTGTGTVTVGLSLDSGATVVREVTVNATDFPVYASWVYFKFSSTVTGVNTNTATIGLKASDAGNVVMSGAGSSTPWAQFVTSTTTKAPASGDKLLIIGEWTGPGTGSTFTVTMDNTDPSLDIGTASPVDVPTATDSKNFNGIWIGQNGVLNWGTSPATNYTLKVSGQFLVFGDGTYNMGTAANPCPRDSTMTLIFDSLGTGSLNVYGFSSWSGSTVNIYGQSRTAGKNITYAKLTADAAVDATSLTIDADTGWLDNDEIAIAATGTDRTQCELGTLNGNAGSSTLTIDGFAGVGGGLAFAHSGTSPTQAEIINLTRNVVIRGNSSTTPGYFRGLGSISTSTMNVYWCRFTWTGQPNGNIFQLSSNVEHCSNFEAGSTTSFRGSLFNNNVFYSTSSVTAVSVDGGASQIPTVTNNVVIRGGTSFSIGPVGGGVYENLSSAGANGQAISTTGTISSSITLLNFVGHTFSQNGINNLGTIPGNGTLTISNAQIWRGITTGIVTSTIRTVVNDSNIFACANGGIATGTSPSFITFNNCRISSDSTTTMPFGFRCQSSSSNAFVNFNNCKFSEVTGIYTANTTDIVVSQSVGTATRPFITLYNTLLGATTEVSGQSDLFLTGFIKSSKHDQTEGAFKSWFQSGIIERDSTLFNTAAPSERLTPTSATIKLASGSRLGVLDDTTTKTISVYVRKSATGDGAEYNGNQPRLIVKANPAMGVSTDTVLDTMTAAVGTWEQLTATTPAVDADGALEFYVDCDGTAGWINVDDWSIT